MNTLLENSALVLGLAISLYTIYAATDSFLVRRRQKLAVIRTLQSKIKYLLTLANSFADLAKNTKDKYIKGDVRDKDPMPDEAKEDVEFLLLRGMHLLDFQVEWESESLATALTEAQLELFMKFVEAHQVYWEVLTVRINHLEKFPHLAKPLALLVLPATLNLQDMNKAYENFESQFLN